MAKKPKHATIELIEAIKGIAPYYGQSTSSFNNEQWAKVQLTLERPCGKRRWDNGNVGAVDYLNRHIAQEDKGVVTCYFCRIAMFVAMDEMRRETMLLNGLLEAPETYKQNIGNGYICSPIAHNKKL